MPISCHFRDCKALLVTSLTHVRGAIASVHTFTFYTSVLFPLFQLPRLADSLGRLNLISRLGDIGGGGRVV